MSLRLLFILSCCSLLLFCLSETAQAAEFEVQVDEKPTPQNGVFENVNDGDRILVKVGLDQCYCCSVFNPERKAVLFTDVTSPGEDPIPFVGRGDHHPAPNFAPNSRVCFRTNNTDGFATSFGEISLGLSVDQGPVAKIFVQCNDTTLHGGYNTAGSDFSYLELRNTLPGLASSDVTATVIFTPPSGGLEGDRGVAIPVAPNGRVDLYLQERVSGFGNLKVCHNGAPGALQADVANYVLDSQSASGLRLLSRTSLRTRSGRN